MAIHRVEMDGRPKCRSPNDIFWRGFSQPADGDVAADRYRFGGPFVL
jgi:hypothetical protein